MGTQRRNNSVQGGGESERVSWSGVFEVGLGKHGSVPGGEEEWRVSPGRRKSTMSNDLTDMIWTQGTAVTGTLRDIARVWGPSVCMLARGEKVRQAETHSRFCSRWWRNKDTKRRLSCSRRVSTLASERFISVPFQNLEFLSPSYHMMSWHSFSNSGLTVAFSVKVSLKPTGRINCFLSCGPLFHKIL